MRHSPSSFPASRLVFALALPLLLALGAGCISTDRTVYRDEPRLKVAFENDTAARLFYEAQARMKTRRTESHTEVSIPVVFDHKEHVVTGDAVTFNEAVRRCDTNGDGKITEQEARIFSEHVANP